jgi:Ca2+/Na+ antiporter
MNKTYKIAGLVLAAAMLAAPDTAFATNGIAGMGDQLRDQIGSLTDLVGAVAFVVGLVFGASGLLKFKQHSENPQGTPLSHAMVRLLVAGGLIALPAVLGTSVGTLFNTSPSSTTSSGGGNMTTINRR